MKRSMYLFISALLAVILLVGCGKGAKEETDTKGASTVEDKTETKKESKENAELGDFEIVFEGEVTEEGSDKFIIEGSSNLLSGSRIIGEILVDDEEVFSDTTELIQEDGKFYMELEHHKYGEAEIVVRFDFDSVQDDEIIRHYGEKGQKLTGPFIYKHKTHSGIYKKAEAKINYVPGETSTLTLAAPDWYDLPDDYGDPRIWIEIEELTEDGEFFYVNAKSNILEGSEIKGSYGGNRDVAQVNPDGSFDFKIDYKYLEDEEFEIEFKPSGFQWNEIEEAYGKNGQKLVGNLVVTNEYNTEQQFIIMHIPWDGKDNSGNSDEDDETSEDADIEKTVETEDPNEDDESDEN